jgi:hypothetical protein
MTETQNDPTRLPWQYCGDPVQHQGHTDVIGSLW